MRQYGNATGVVPYSVLLSPDAEVLARHLGAFSEAELNELLERHLQGEAAGTRMPGVFRKGL